MIKKTIFYCIALALLVVNFIYFNTAYRELIRSTELTNRSVELYRSFQNIEGQIRSAAVTDLNLLNKDLSPEIRNIFYADSASVVRELNSLKAAAEDPATRKIAEQLDVIAKSELQWMLKSDVPDSIIAGTAPVHVAAFKRINMLIKDGMRRADVLINLHKETQSEKMMAVRIWRIVFLILTGFLLFYTIYEVFREKTKNEKRFRILIENSNDIITLLNKDLFTVYRSPSAERLTGFSGEDRKVGMKIEEVHPDDKDLVLLKLTETGANPGKPIPASFRMMHKAGHYIWLEGTFTNLFHEPRVKAVLVNMRDVTAQRQDYLHRQLLESIVNSSDDAIISKTLSGIVTSWNRGAEKILGYTADEMIGESISRIIPGDLKQEEVSIIESITNRTPVHHYETERIRKDGSIINVSLTISPVFDAAGNVTGASKILRDITERKQTEKRIEDANREKNIILESIGDAFFAVDRNWTVTYWNKLAEEKLMVEKDNILGVNLWSIFSESVGSLSYLQYHTAMATKSPAHFEDYFAPLDRWFEVSAYPSASGLSVYFKDITARKVSEMQLIALNEGLLQKSKELAISNNELEQFAYIASHDMQEPLRMVTGFLSQLEKKYKDTIDDRGRQYIDFAMDGAKRMRRIILDLLDFSVIGRRGEEDEEEADLNEVIREVEDLYAKEIAEKKAAIIAKDLPVIRTVRSSAYRIFQNLIGNALKYSKEGIPPVITVSAENHKGRWEFSVSDNGIGISEEFFDKIFVIFQRLHTDNKSGTGIGLAICKKIAERHGGSIRVESAEGAGSTFYFTLTG